MTEQLPLDVETLRNIIDKLFEKLGEVLKTVNVDAWGENLKQLPSLRDNMVSWILEGIKPGSPEWKTDSESGLNKLLKEWTDKIAGDLLELKLPEAPFKPEDAVDVSERYKQLSVGIHVSMAIVAIIVEIASLGQVDRLVEVVGMIDNVFGLSRTSSALQQAKFYPALITPIQHYYNAQYQSAIPGSGDLVNFVVRESFPLEELPEAPEQFTEYMKYQNFSALWCRAYWHAHWRLVAVGDLYDLFHRKEITGDELKEQLVLHDYRPEWTDRLLTLSYKLIPRVDLRRAWELGAIDTPELERRMGLIGYSPDDAGLETNLQIRVALSAEMTKLVDDTRVDFIDGAILEDTARANLLELGLHPDVVEYRIADFKKDYERQRRKAKIDIYSDAYQKDQLTEVQLDTHIHELLTNEEVIQDILAEEYIRKYKKPKAG